jgi:hypothetical protein
VTKFLDLVPDVLMGHTVETAVWIVKIVYSLHVVLMAHVYRGADLAFMAECAR